MRRSQLELLELDRRFGKLRGRHLAQQRRRVRRPRGHRQPRIGERLVVGRQRGHQIAGNLCAALAQDTVEAGNLVLAREISAVLVEELLFIGPAEGGDAPAVARKARHVIRARSRSGFQAAHMAGAGQWRKGGEVAPDLARRDAGIDAVLRLAAQHFRLGPVGVLAQEAPGGGEVRIGARSGAEHRPIDDAGQQRVLEIRDRGARVGVTAVVGRPECGSQRGGFGGAEGLGRVKCLRELARSGGRQSGVVVRVTSRRVVRGWRTANADIRRGLAQSIAAFAAQGGRAALLRRRGCSKQGGEQDQGELCLFHTRNCTQVKAASLWQVAHLAAISGGA